VGAGGAPFAAYTTSQLSPSLKIVGLGSEAVHGTVSISTNNVAIMQFVVVFKNIKN
jgi:hypothetical protein